jgi:hypothetical protein
MCMLSYYPEGIQPDLERLHNGAETNRDGYGWAIAAGGKLLTGKGLGEDQVIGQFEAARKEHPGGPALFHSRFSTSGNLRDVDNCHPFTVGRDKQTVLAHNGVLFDMPKGDARSDTRYFAETMIKPEGFTRFDKPSVRRALEKWLGPANKIVVLTVNPRYREHSYIFNEKSGIWTGDGEWHSNDGYLPSRWSYRGGWCAGPSVWTAEYLTDEELAAEGWETDDRGWWTRKTGKTGRHWQQWRPSRWVQKPYKAYQPPASIAGGERDCQVCGEPDAIWGGECTLCGCCEECHEPPQKCDCYAPPSYRARADAGYDPVAEAEAVITGPGN